MDNSVITKIEALTQAYAQKMPSKAKQIEFLWNNFKRDHDSENWSNLQKEIHILCGTAGTYGYVLLSKVAKDIEIKLDDLKQNYQLDTVNEVENLIADLQQLAIKMPEKSIDHNINFDMLIQHASNINIYTLDASNDSSLKPIQELTQFNYCIKFFSDTTEFLQAVFAKRPNMVMMDIALANEISREDIQRIHDEMIIITYTTKQDDLTSRLFSVRHLGQALIVKPFDTEYLLRVIDNLLAAQQIRDGRVLIVDDSEALADYYATILSHAGIITQQISNTENFLVDLQEFQPDLILMDINMPFCNGTELAQLVHQEESLSGVPIIFLSTIAEKAKQLEVLSIAGDDFLTKPVDPKHLLSAVRNRLIRSYVLRSRMMRDGLTNLYNHSMIHNQLERELVLAARYHRELAIALIDIDHFKEVNDKYGHQAGDKILKSLSLFLQKNLRSSDLIGRYGGEEFLIVFPNTSAENALRIVNSLREKFAQTTHMLGSNTIHITLSGGIASYPEINLLSKLVKAADDALYQAKEGGRNLIMRASTQ